MDANKSKMGILSWKGMFADEEPKFRLGVFLALFVVAMSMTFVQLGFVGVDGIGGYAGYAFGLLAPVTAAALLLGKKWGALEGVAAGAVLLLHSHEQPLDIIEKFFVTWVSSVALYAVVGLVMGFLFALTLRKKPQGARRVVALLVPCLVVSVLLGMAFEQFLVWRVVELNTPDSLQAFVGIGSIWVQIISDLALMFGVSLVADSGARWHERSKSYVSVRTIFRVRLLISLFLLFMTVSAGGFVAITLGQELNAYYDIEDELVHIGGEFSKRWGSLNDVFDMPEVMNLPDEAFAAIAMGIGPDQLLDGNALEDGTVCVYSNGMLLLTNNPAMAKEDALYGSVASTAEDAGASDAKEEPLPADSQDTYGTEADSTPASADSAYADNGFSDDEIGLYYSLNDAAAEIAETGQMRMMVYNNGSGHFELGYMRAIQAQRRIWNGLDEEPTYEDVEDTYIMMARPFSMIFAHRYETMLWTSLSALVLMVGIYLLVSRLLRQNLMDPIDRTNASLGKIIEGDLDEQVSEVGTIEFASLSAGINATVDALKEYAAESARRIERDLATARRIQEGALPKSFPAFPDVGAVDLFASMDAAKEVGGDFYDFFEVDGRTVAFLIADVSGKGIPGALFMMAAKAEIQSHLSRGVAPAEAIAQANQYLCANNEAGMFVTVWAATLDWQTGRLTYVNAGHNFPLLRRGREGRWEWLTKKCGLFLGTFETARYRQEELVLEPGDELLLYTDGVNEAFSASDEEYGNDRLEAFLAAHADLRPDGLVPALRADVAAWAEGAEQSDDVTILAVEYRLGEGR